MQVILTQDELVKIMSDPTTQVQILVQESLPPAPGPIPVIDTRKKTRRSKRRKIDRKAWEKIGRRIAASAGKARGGNAEAWTPADEKYLRDNYEQKTGESIAAHLGRTLAAVRMRAQVLGVQRKRPGKKAANRTHEWKAKPLSEKRDAIKKKYAGTMIDAPRDDEYMRRVRQETAPRPKITDAELELEG